MIVGIINELDDNRVALTPKGAEELIKLGSQVLLESGAGDQAGFIDGSYPEGVTIAKRSEILSKADVLVTIDPLAPAEYNQVKKGSVFVSMFAPFQDDKIAGQLDADGYRAFSLDMVPRITIAQSMDVLSSMASIAGYKAVLTAADHLDKYMPMLMTAAGTIKPAKMVILGAGVAGLQAIATGKRLGAVVEVFDTRSAVKEEVQSLGGKFIEVEGAVEDAGAGGYGVQQSEEFLERQRALVQKKASEADIVITTAQVRGRKAPILVPKETVEKMRPGSVIVDLAASTGGNCALTKDREVIKHNGVIIIGDSKLAATVPKDASTMFSNNVLNFMKLWVKDGEIILDMENEVIKGALITKPTENA